MSYYTRVKSFLTGTTAKGVDVKSEFDSVQAGFALVEADFADFGALDQAVLDAETAEYNAQQWAESPEDTEVPSSPGSYSSLHWAAKSAASAAQAATFDPANFYLRTWIDANIYTETEVDSLLTNKVSITDTDWTIITTNYAASVRESLFLITTIGSFAVTLPASPASGDWVRFGVQNVETYTFDIDPGAYQIEDGGAGVKMTVDISNKEFVLVYVAAGIWEVIG